MCFVCGKERESERETDRERERESAWMRAGFHVYIPRFGLSDLSDYNSQTPDFVVVLLLLLKQNPANIKMDVNLANTLIMNLRVPNLFKYPKSRPTN